MRIVIETIPHSDQRYDTVGDYWTDPDGTIQLRVSDLGNWKYETLVAVHELVELSLCRSHEVSHVEIDKFDFEWKPHADILEPGDDPAAPYYYEHQVAMGIERTLSAVLAVNWLEYERVIESQVYKGEDDADED